MIKTLHVLTIYLGIFVIASPAFAYIGPGMAGGVFSVIIGVLVALIMIFLGIIYYPLKRLFKNRKGPEQVKEDQTHDI